MRLRGKNIKTQQNNVLNFTLYLKIATARCFCSYKFTIHYLFAFIISTHLAPALALVTTICTICLLQHFFCLLRFNTTVVGNKFTGENFVWRNFLASVNSYCGPYQKHTLDTYTSLHSVTSQKPHTR